MGDKELQAFKIDYSGIQRFIGDNKGLQEITTDYRCYTGLKEITRD